MKQARTSGSNLRNTSSVCGPSRSGMRTSPAGSQPNVEAASLEPELHHAKDKMIIIDHEHAGLIAELSDHCLLGSPYGQRCRLATNWQASRNSVTLSAIRSVSFMTDPDGEGSPRKVTPCLSNRADQLLLDRGYPN
jgi:hypothetical protein